MSKPTVSYWMMNTEQTKMVHIGTIAIEYQHIVDEFIRELAKPVGARSEPIVVLEVDERVLAKSWLGKQPRPVAVGQIFPSAMHASAYLGYRYNVVSVTLSKDRRERERQAVESAGENHTWSIRPQAVVNGVTFQYDKDVRD